MKVVFETPTGRLLGAQVVGGSGAEKRVYIIATAMHFGGNMSDLASLQLAYAPPFGSAKDPVNMAGYIAMNVLTDNQRIWHWSDLAREKAAGAFFLDVRTPEEYRCGHIEGSVNIPDTELRGRLEEVPLNRPIRVYCQVGFRGYIAQRLLNNRGYSDVRNLSGGYKTFEMATATIDDVRKMCALPAAVARERIEGRPADDLLSQGGVVKVDATGLTCPGPLNALIRTVHELPKGGIAEITASDPGFLSSVTVWTRLTDGVENLGVRKDHGNIIALVRRTKEKLILAVEEEPKTEIFPTPTQPPIKKGRVKPAGEPPVTEISPVELNDRILSSTGPIVIVDVRPKQEIKMNGGAIPGSRFIELGDLVKNPDQLKEYKNQEVVLTCASGMRSLMAAKALAQMGYQDVRSLRGGASTWIRMGFSTVPV
ncbi:MAG: FAD-dependent pyridine nucleotide-disulfide oxidoreductase [Promethearchaeota archaeon CR_4]|nr:MAG: FAD-dependent pyridine nucleotide-disulfide oxidoreductase [Candidatus Lokiarchaeota archaeon CR_4]